MNEAISHLPRKMQRSLLSNEARRRKSGEWGAWQRIELPSGLPHGSGWNKEIRAATKNKVFCVLERPLEHAIHLAVSSLSGVRPSWHEMMRIKNDLAGHDATAVEVYPPADEVVDGADMYHIWVVQPLPFSLFGGE